MSVARLQVVGSNGERAAPEDPRPTIRMGPELHALIDASVDALASDPDLYTRGGRLVHVVRLPTRGTTLDGELTPLAPSVRPLPSATLRERLTTFARYERAEKGDDGTRWVQVVPNNNIVAGVIDRGAWSRLRPLDGVIEAPTLRPDDSVLESPGYDVATRLLYEPGAVFDRVPPWPTQDDATAGLVAFVDVLQDFPFRSAADLAGVVAAVLTAVGRSAIVGNVPAFLMDAPTPASGKSLLTDAIHLIATGRCAEKRTLPEADEELEKVLGAIALRGAPFVCFDNLSATLAFGGAPIDRVLTCEGVTAFRVLGRSEDAVMPWVQVIIGSGNNIALRGDAERRVLLPRVEPQEERPEERTGFRYPDLRAHLRIVRPRLVVAALTILRAFIVAGRPDMGTKVWGSFEAWSRLVPPAIVFAGGADPMGCRPAATSTASEERGAVVVVLEAFARIEKAAGGKGITWRSFVDALYPMEREAREGDGYGDAREAIEDLTHTAAGKRPSALTLNRKLARWKGRPVNGRRLDLVGKTRTDVGLWHVSDGSGGAPGEEQPR